MNAHNLFHAGKLSEALAAATEEVRSQPTAPGPRLFLSELLCFSGELERADSHLDAVGHTDPQLVPWVITSRQLIRAEQARLDFYREGRLPEFLKPPEGPVRLLLEASIRLREGDNQAAAQLLAQAEDLRPKAKGVCNEQAFEDLRDLDDSAACIFEVLTTKGQYYWIPIADVESIAFREPARPRDLLWRRVALAVRNGPDGEVFLPVLYPGAETETDEQLRLGRSTDWRGGDGTPVRGAGQRMFLVGEASIPILELKSLTIEQTPPA